MGGTLFQRAWYSDEISHFLHASPETILGELSTRATVDMQVTQRDAWLEEIRVLKKALEGIRGRVYLEFTIPRMGHRADCIIVAEGHVVVLEFKVGKGEYSRDALDQVCDYTLDLKYFHKGSHHATVIPVLVATAARAERSFILRHPRIAGLYHPLRSNGQNLAEVLRLIFQEIQGRPLNPLEWENAPYEPTPTIVEAARALYAGHGVHEIARSDAGAQHLRQTTERVNAIIDECARKKKKAICFVTGVPGAGKTLVGLNLAAQRSDPSLDQHTVFLSGNGPLVAILQEALTRDTLRRMQQQGQRRPKGEVKASVKSFIQNVHHFRDEAVRSKEPPHDRVAIFDEAQRAWNREQTAKFMRQKKGILGFNQSEPEFLVETMDRHQDWAAIVCLVGSGQEINTGEAGIGEWLESVNKSHFQHWDIFVSPQFEDPEFGSESLKPLLRQSPRVCWCDELHLKVSMRSFRSENVSAFVNALLDLDVRRARQHVETMRDNGFLTYITRDLDRAKAWVREQAFGGERYGMVVSSQAERLKPYAIDVRYKIDPVLWFLNDKEDVRSSYYLEDVASEFDVQGLELDWTLVAWDGDFRCGEDNWGHYSFRGDRWETIRKPERQKYQKNAYRVLLTRARQGMVIFVPPGDRHDPTRDPDFYDGTWRYLCDAGLPVLP